MRDLNSGRASLLTGSVHVSQYECECACRCHCPFLPPTSFFIYHATSTTFAQYHITDGATGVVQRGRSGADKPRNQPFGKPKAGTGGRVTTVEAGKGLYLDNVSVSASGVGYKYGVVTRVIMCRRSRSSSRRCRNRQSPKSRIRCKHRRGITPHGRCHLHRQQWVVKQKEAGGREDRREQQATARNVTMSMLWRV